MPWCSGTLGGCREAGLTGRWSPLLAAALLGSEPPRTLHTIPLPACPRPAKVLSSPELQTLSHSSHHTLQLATIQRRVDFPRSRFPFASPCRLPFPCHTAFRVFLFAEKILRCAKVARSPFIDHACSSRWFVDRLPWACRCQQQRKQSNTGALSYTSALYRFILRRSSISHISAVTS